MYIIDTNIFSELVRPVADKRVINQYYLNLNHIYLASTVWHELYYGYQTMPKGRKSQDVYQFLTTQVETLPLLNYDKACADIHATIRAKAKQSGKPVSYVDSQIASIALANNMTLVTRNMKDFDSIDNLILLNWFE